MRHHRMRAAALLAVLLITLVPVGLTPLRAQAPFVVTQCQEGQAGQARRSKRARPGPAAHHV